MSQPPAYSSQNPFPNNSSVNSIASSLPPYSSQPPPNMPPLPPSLAAQQPLVLQRMPQPPQSQPQFQPMQSPFSQILPQQLSPGVHMISPQYPTIPTYGSVYPSPQIQYQMQPPPQIQYQMPMQAPSMIFPPHTAMQQFMPPPPGKVYSPSHAQFVTPVPSPMPFPPQPQVQLPSRLITHGGHLHYFPPGQIPGLPMVPGGAPGQTPGFQGVDRAPVPFNGPPRAVEMILPGESEPTIVLLPGVMPDGTIGPYANSGGLG